MVEVFPQLLLHPPPSPLETLLTASIYFEQRQRREVSHHLVNLRVHGRTIEERQVDREVLMLAPRRQHLGVGGHQDARRRQPAARTALLEPRPARGLHAPEAAREARAGERRGILRQRQLRRRRQSQYTIPPILL